MSAEQSSHAVAQQKVHTNWVPEDALAYLPCSAILEFHKGERIYGPHDGSANIYVIIEGRVKLSRLSEEGCPVVVDLYHTDDFFGESALLGSPREYEEAVALEKVKLMTWTASQIEALIHTQPRLAIALLQVLVRRTVDFKHRLESFSVESTAPRLARSLLHFGERFGGPPDGGSITIAPLTHEILAQYVGTSREIVTHYMAEFRRQGYIRYSRRGITVHFDGLQAWLRASGH
jgi:CRP/FNR family transcriptional regulator